MDVGDLPLADRFVAHYRERGIERLYPPQAAAVEAGVCRGENVLAAVPTASGKTFVAQLAMLTADGPALYVVPLRALATEKYEEFDALPGVDVGIATGEFDATDEDLAEHDVVVATSEKVDSAIRNGAEWVRQLRCAVVDEIHLLDAESRGPTLEVTVGKLRRLTPAIQLVGLSATVANAGEVADWLDARLVESDWRPVDLRTGVHSDDAITFDDGEVRELPAEGDQTRALVVDAVEGGGQCLVFVSSRRAARALADDLAEEGFAFPDEAVEAIRETAVTGTGTDLARTVARGVAFHHAGLRSDHRSAVERAFREGELKVICATPTLAAGVNVPARRVVVRDTSRYVDGGTESLPVLEVHQMFGRAGRPGLDPYGEAILVAGPGEAEDLRERYIGAEPEAVASKLAGERAMRTHVLATVASGFADSRADLREVFSETFYAHQRGEDALDGATDDAIDYLRSVGMLTTEAGLAATELGALVSRVYVDPVTGADVVAKLERAADIERVTALTALEIVCDTPDMTTGYVRSDEAGEMSGFAMRNEAVFARSVAEFDGDFQAWLGTLKTARSLADYAAGVSLDEIGERYGVDPGDVRRSTERAVWLLTATESLAEQVERDGPDLREVRERIRETREALAEREA